MDKKALLREIQKQTNIFFEKTGFEGDVKAEFDDGQETILLSIKLEDPQVLIGKNGEKGQPPKIQGNHRGLPLHSGNPHSM